MAKAGQTVGRCEVVSRIGRGGIGVVHLARQLELDMERVAGSRQCTLDGLSPTWTLDRI